MRKIFFAAILSLVTVLCVSATVAEVTNADSMDYTSSVTATIAGDGEGIDFETKTLVVIYNLMPQKVKDLCVASYKDIAPRIEKSKAFTYQGVRITPIQTEVMRRPTLILRMLCRPLLMISSMVTGLSSRV